MIKVFQKLDKTMAVCLQMVPLHFHCSHQLMSAEMASVEVNLLGYQDIEFCEMVQHISFY